VKLLPDTHLLLWTADDSPRLPKSARTLIDHPENDIYFSVASLWEVAIKCARGDEDFQVNPNLFRERLFASGYTELPIKGEHAVAVFNLPPIHKDPFDRLLIAQATVEGILLLTVDKQLTRYPGPIRKV
jgi:PIN domain nuclease of toxin-antitoxin system